MTEETIWIGILNIAASLLLTGMVWLLQLLFYPTLEKLHRADFVSHHRSLYMRITLLALPVMLIELTTSVWLVLYAETRFLYHLAGLIAVGMIWLSSLFLHIPIHIRLRKGFDERLVQRLGEINWIRIILWSAKSLISLQVLHGMILPD